MADDIVEEKIKDYIKKNLKLTLRKEDDSTTSTIVIELRIEEVLLAEQEIRLTTRFGKPWLS